MTPKVHVAHFPSMDATPRKTFVDACDTVCVVCLTFMTVLQTREWELSPICSVCTHVESNWSTGREQGVPVLAGPCSRSSALLHFELGLAKLLCLFRLLHAVVAALV